MSPAQILGCGAVQSPGWVTSSVQGEGLVGLTPLSPQDYISLFPLDDTQPSKLMRLLSSNEEDSNILSSPSKCRRGGGMAFPFWKCVFAQNPFPNWLGEGLELSSVF